MPFTNAFVMLEERPLMRTAFGMAKRNTAGSIIWMILRDGLNPFGRHRSVHVSHESQFDAIVEVDGRYHLTTEPQQSFTLKVLYALADFCLMSNLILARLEGNEAELACDDPQAESLDVTKHKWRSHAATVPDDTPRPTKTSREPLNVRDLWVVSNVPEHWAGTVQYPINERSGQSISANSRRFTVGEVTSICLFVGTRTTYRAM